jgi:phage tail protein X
MANIDIPTPGGIPDFVPVPMLSVAPLPVAKTGRIYVTTQGDWWDLIALRVYGMKRGDDHLMHKLIEANYVLRDISNFPAGVAVMVPDVPVRTEIPLVPWKSAYIGTSP